MFIFFNRLRRISFQLALGWWRDFYCFFPLRVLRVISRERIHSGLKWWHHWIQSFRTLTLLLVYLVSIRRSQFYLSLSGMIWNHTHFHVCYLMGRIIFILDIFLRFLLKYWWKVHSYPRNPQTISKSTQYNNNKISKNGSSTGIGKANDIHLRFVEAIARNNEQRRILELDTSNKNLLMFQTSTF